ncbi:hypothetical protein GDO78_015629 [Eleutherodactylus coqui]|uniref:Uncharacterized protein n=1 Tax=Eleutherodactylus coqui TaxID=57060 RepID=A0A8J6EDF8_ELECQ|nr:hypothetical protein GDO78_015629 [Eleutherodactylus coqui]
MLGWDWQMSFGHRVPRITFRTVAPRLTTRFLSIGDDCFFPAFGSLPTLTCLLLRLPLISPLYGKTSVFRLWYLTLILIDGHWALSAAGPERNLLARQVEMLPAQGFTEGVKC